MQNQKSRLAIIHLAKKQLGLDEEAYRAILSGVGVASAKDIETELQFNTVMGAFLRLGFLPSRHGGLNKYRSAIPGTSPAMISRRQEYYIKGLWSLASRVKDEKSLRHVIKRIGKVDDIRFLPRRSASAVILALRDICWKAGFNPDKEESYATDGKKRGENTAHGASSSLLSPDDGRNRICQNRQSLAAVAGSGKRIC
jgi:hypothetical protein